MTTILSRSGSSSPLGKLSYEVKTGVAECVGEALVQLAKKAGMCEREYVREVLTIHALGYDHVRKVYQDRLEMLSRMGPETGEL